MVRAHGEPIWFTALTNRFLTHQNRVAADKGGETTVGLIPTAMVQAENRYIDRIAVRGARRTDSAVITRSRPDSYPQSAKEGAS